MIGHPPLREAIGANALGTVAATDQAFTFGGDFGVLLALLRILDAYTSTDMACALFLCCERPS